MYNTHYKGNLREEYDINALSRDAHRLSDDDVNYLISQYDGEIRYTDEMLKIFLKTLKDLNISDKTLIFIGSDHGEEFNEHNHLGHGISLYDNLIHTPLIMINSASNLKNVKISNQVKNWI